jgi:hypothetical protein
VGVTPAGDDHALHPGWSILHHHTPLRTGEHNLPSQLRTIAPQLQTTETQLTQGKCTAFLYFKDIKKNSGRNDLHKLNNISLAKKQLRLKNFMTPEARIRCCMPF